RRIRAPRRGIERVADRVQKIPDRLFLARVLAEEPAEVVVDVGIVGRKPERAVEAVLGTVVLAQIHVDEAVHAVRRRKRSVRPGGKPQLLEGDAHVAALVVRGGELGMHSRAIARVADLADYRAGIAAL